MARPDTPIALKDIEAAIDWWRARRPSVDGIVAAPEVRALAEVCAALSWQRSSAIAEPALPSAAHAAWAAWAESQPDSPCIAICSTAQGDAICKGCGRTETEVQHWTALGLAERRAVWHRIDTERSAWRYNRYAERARLTERRAAEAAG